MMEETGDQTVAKTSVKDPNDERSQRSRAMIHSVSIVVETVHDDCDALPVSLDRGLGPGKGTNDSRLPPQSTPDTDSEDRQSFPRKERHQSSPVIFLDHEVPVLSESKPESGDQQSLQSIIATARLRKEAFARLLEEHAQLVDQINRAETSSRV